MAQTPAKIDLQKFLQDPAFQGDKEFLEGFVDQHLERRAREAKERAEREEQNEPENFFDRLFQRKG